MLNRIKSSYKIFKNRKFLEFYDYDSISEKESLKFIEANLDVVKGDILN